MSHHPGATTSERTHQGLLSLSGLFRSCRYDTISSQVTLFTSHTYWCCAGSTSIHSLIPHPVTHIPATLCHFSLLYVSLALSVAFYMYHSLCPLALIETTQVKFPVTENNTNPFQPHSCILFEIDGLRYAQVLPQEPHSYMPLHLHPLIHLRRAQPFRMYPGACKTRLHVAISRSWLLRRERCIHRSAQIHPNPSYPLVYIRMPLSLIFWSCQSSSSMGSPSPSRANTLR